VDLIPSLVACDWNGTLVADADRARGATGVVLARRGLHPLTRRAFRDCFRLPLTAFFQDLGVTSGDLDRAVREWNRALLEIPASSAPGLTTMLEGLASADVPVGVVSAADRTVVEQDARRLGVLDSLAFIQAGVTDKARSLAALVAARAAPVVYLGDTEHDVAAARRAGAVPVAVSYGYRPGSALLAAGAALLLSDLSRLPAALGLATVEAQP
jgi:phosphoglycolate phosphatase-like HAD superfamily hydrolase